MTTESKGVISAAQDTLQLFNLMAADFQPRTHNQIVELATRAERNWSSTKVHNMLKTLAAENFIRQSATTGEWSISPHITAIAVNFHESIIRRSEAILTEVAEIKNAQEREQ